MLRLKLGIFMTRYNKGANAERELIKELFLRGFAVLRVAGSGSNPLPCPDVVALKKGKVFAFECKARKGNYLPISIEQMDEEIGWAEQAGAEFFIAWKVPRQGWLFFKKENFRLAGKNYMITLDEAKAFAVSFKLLD
jgi:holliday junction resolvase Hjr